MATTHTEVYRGFTGAVSSHPFRWLPLFLSEFSIATRKKLPLLLLFGPVAISTIVAMVYVYLQYTLEALGSEQYSADMNMSAAIAMSTVKAMLDVRIAITEFYSSMSVFCLLAATWFGSGLICEDRRVNAHLLYFSRPLNRMQYFLGKFATVAVFSSFAMLLPGIFICLMAVMNSPDYAFLYEQGDVIVFSTLYALLWIFSISCFVLAISSLAPKKLFALVGVFALFVLPEMGAGVAELIGGLDAIQYLSPGANLGALAEWMMAKPGAEFTSHELYSALGAAGMVGLALLILARRLKQMELSV